MSLILYGENNIDFLFPNLNVTACLMCYYCDKLPYNHYHAVSVISSEGVVGNHNRNKRRMLVC